jgi:segregation and condensation protein A
MEIKSAMLLPQAEPEQMAQEESGDPRAELIRQLLEYKRFKDAANLLDAAAEQHQERFGRPASLIDRLVPNAEPEIDMDQVSIWDLLEAFDAICKATGTQTYTGHIRDDTPIDLYQIEVLHRLQTEGALTFERIFDAKPNRLVMVGLFLALLELIRNKLVWAEQGENSSQIYVRSLTDEPPEQAVQRAIMAVGEAEAEAAPQTEVVQTPPIPIVEIPAQARVEEQEEVEDVDNMDEMGNMDDLEDTEEDAASADDDFAWDEP